MQYDVISMWVKKNKQKQKINEQTKPKENKHTDTENRIVITREEGPGGRLEWVKGVTCMVMDAN